MRGPYKAPKLVMPREARVRALAEVALQSAITQIRRNTRGARLGLDPEYGHQLRVGVRRLRVYLRLFERCLDRARAASIAEELRWIFQRLGTAREYDVLLDELVLPLLAARPVEGLEPLVAALRREQTKAARAAQRALSSKRYARLLRALRLLPARLCEGGAGARRARKWARKRLEKRLRAALVLEDAAEGRDEVARHELRKQLKKLRYTAELMRGLWSPRRVKRFIEPLAALQDVLGGLNDVAVGRTLLVRERERSRGSGPEQAAIVACEQALDERFAEHWAELAPTFSRFADARPFWL